MPRHREATQRAPIVDFLENRDDSRLHRRIARQSYLAPTVLHQGNGNQRPLVSSIRTSMLVAGSQVTDLSDLAALTDAPTMPSSHSLSSSVGARQLDNNQRMLDFENGALVIAPLRVPRVLECPFYFLLCCLTFSNIEDWIAHSLEHFRTPDGREIGPSAFNQCCFCDIDFRSDPSNSWRERMHHVSLHHRHGHRLSHARPDFHLFYYLWQNRLMSDRDYRELRGNLEDPPVARDKSVAERAYPSPPQSPETGRARVIEGGLQDSYSSVRRRREEGQRRR